MHPARRRLAFLSAALAAVLALVLPLSSASAATAVLRNGRRGCRKR
jgi:hypothetical protein